MKQRWPVPAVSLPPLPSPLGPCSFNALSEALAGDPGVPRLSFPVHSQESSEEHREKGQQREVHHGPSLSTKKADLWERPCSWETLPPLTEDPTSFRYKAGRRRYYPNSGVNWANRNGAQGQWDFKDLCVCQSLSRVRLFVTPWTVAHQAPLSMEFSRQEYWSGLPFPSPGDLPNLEIKPRSPALQADSLPSEPQGKISLARFNFS